MVNRGWIGTSSAQSSSLAQLISEFLNTGRAIMVAVEEDAASKQNQANT
ncbi:TPA: hypothetical protein ACPHRY_003117 [Vibrio antiquarius]